MAIDVHFKIFKDPASALSHLIGLIAAIVGLTFLCVFSPPQGPKLAGLAIYGGTLTALFLASSCYHFFDFGEKGNLFLRRLDHSAIFLLIAGTYMPILIHALDGAWRISMISVIGGVALIGLIIHLFWIHAPRWITAAMYLILGWAVVVPGYKLWHSMTGGQLGWLFGGGAAYTLGAVIYAKKWPDPWPGKFGFHEIWHLFVLAGAVLHYFMVFSFVGKPYPPF